MTQPSNPLYEGHELESLGEAPNYYRWILDGFLPHLSGDGVEFGAGIGTMSRRIRPHLDTLDIVEPSENLIPGLHGDFGAQTGTRIFHETLESFAARQPSNAYDCVVMVNVLEHFEEDAGIAVEMFRILRHGGCWLVFVPAMAFLFSDLDRRFGHFRRYSRQGLGTLARLAGFDVVGLRYFDLLGVLPWWLINTVGGATELNPRLTRIYDACGVPLTRAIEAIIPPPIGKNLVLVARRPKDR